MNIFQGDEPCPAGRYFNYCHMKTNKKFANKASYLAVIFIMLLAGFSCSLPREKEPFTQKQFISDTSRLQFAIISDLWGGYRPGVFEDAIEKLELLQPQFVISVGDLIDGATLDPFLLDSEWDSFNEEVSRLSIPFYYLPGNHDISNPWMEEEWIKRFGKTYYYFLKNEILFLCINTEDGGKSGIGPDQVSYFINAISENQDTKWIFVFMHRPVWQYEDGKMDGYAGIENALKGKNYTVFSGHHHTYLKEIKSGNNHYTLGTTGGGSDLRGNEFGEFDHITWVTVKALEQPRIVNIRLDGMLRDDINTRK